VAAAGMADPWVLFATVAGAHALGVASPGPDFAVVVRQTLRAGRRAGIATALGIGSGILFHVGYSLFGLSWLLLRWPGLMTALRYGGAALLLYLGISALWPRPASPPAVDGAAAVPVGRSYWVGLATNLLNAKAMLFFVALSTAVITQATPYSLRVLLGVWLCAATAAWFSLVALTLGHSAVRAQLIRIGPMLDRAMGVLFIVLALAVLGFWPRS
jgi:threonine/homoserine/homoserine lactone efflux protein